MNHLLFMHDLKLFSKSNKQRDTLVKTVHVFSTDIGMEFGTKRCGILTLKGGKVVIFERIKKWSNEQGRKGRIHIFGHS